MHSYLGEIPQEIDLDWSFFGTKFIAVDEPLVHDTSCVIPREGVVGLRKHEMRSAESLLLTHIVESWLGDRTVTFPLCTFSRDHVRSIDTDNLILKPRVSKRGGRDRGDSYAFQVTTECRPVV